MIVDTLNISINNSSIFIPYIHSNDNLVLIDAGYPNMASLIDDGLKKKGLSLSLVTEIWITHHDHDHVGSLAEIKAMYPNIKVKASEAEIPYIQGEKISLRLYQARERQSLLPLDEQTQGLAFISYLNTITPCKVDDLLYLNELLLDDEVVVLDTKGHTEGHISFYVPYSQTLITGDLLALEDGKLIIPFPQFSYNLDVVKDSLSFVSSLPIRNIICYHGGLLSGSNPEIKAMIENLL